MSHRYFPHTGKDVKEMLHTCGASALADLYSDVPEQLRLRGGYRLPSAQSEPEVVADFERKDRACRPLTCFAGAGVYDHYTPAVIESIMSRSEYLTAYTPYQPEISQGTLQYIFEYQSMMSQMTGLEVCNASMYDGATATAEAMIMTIHAARKKNRVLASATLNPAVLDVVSTYARYHNVDLDIIAGKDGVTDKGAIMAELQYGNVAGLIVPLLNYYGIIEDLTGLSDAAHAVKALLVVNAPASPLAVLRSPGEWGADIAVGDAQSLGMPMCFGGPYLGYMCATKTLMRKLPGRIVGATTDEKRQRTFVLTLQAREQHIRREKATSNICSNQGIMTLHAAIYMSLMGAKGLREVNRLSAAAAHHLAAALVATGKMAYKYPDKPYLNETALTVTAPLTAERILEALAGKGILGGVALDEQTLLVAATECRTRDEINEYVQTVKTLEP